MLLSSAQNATGQEGNFPRLLKKWRHKRHLSQLDLAWESGVSLRHVSFLESGRARPSRSMILQLPETLEVPLRYRNDWLIAAGFAPLFTVRSFDDPQIRQAMAVGGKNGGLGKKKRLTKVVSLRGSSW